MTPVDAARAKIAEGLHLVDEGRRLVDEGLALLGSAPGSLTQVVTTRVMDRMPGAGNEVAGAPLLLDVPEAARLMGISEVAFRSRLNRGQVSGVVRTGKRIQVHRERLLAGSVKTKPSRQRTDADAAFESKRKEKG